MSIFEPKIFQAFRKEEEENWVAMRAKKSLLASLSYIESREEEIKAPFFSFEAWHYRSKLVWAVLQSKSQKKKKPRKPWNVELPNMAALSQAYTKVAFFSKKCSERRRKPKKSYSGKTCQHSDAQYLGEKMEETAINLLLGCFVFGLIEPPRYLLWNCKTLRSSVYCNCAMRQGS